MQTTLGADVFAASIMILFLHIFMFLILFQMVE